jgi:photosystem II stability/assembly factor-like uncharacterized protein
MIRALATLLYVYTISGMFYSSLPQTNPWKRQLSPVNSTLRSLSFADSLTGWAAGEDGIIIHTTDGGNNWEIQNSTVQTFITDIFFINNDVGWATTIKDVFPFNTIILKTIDGGVNWVAENFQDTTALMRTIFFFDSLNGFIGGSYIAYTSDGGYSWVKADVDSNTVSNFPVYEFNFYNKQCGYACGGRLDVSGVVWRTTNYGLNWYAQGISADEIFDTFIFDSLNAIILSGDPEGLYAIAKIKTTDGGINWSSENLLFYGLSFKIDFRTYNEGWSASGYKFLFTSDRGETWGEIETPDSSIVYDLQFTDSLTGFAVGEEGIVLKISYPRPTNPLPSCIKLFQNYPNPFNNTTIISWQQVTDEYTTLKVFNSLGQEIMILFNEYLTAGDYSVCFKPKPELSSGVYFYILQAGFFNQTKKMVLIK